MSRRRPTPPRSPPRAKAARQPSPPSRATWLEVALDVLAQARAEATTPLEKVLASVVRSRALGSHERRRVGDVVFAWARRRASIDARLGPLSAGGRAQASARDRNVRALLVAAIESDLLTVDDVAELAEAGADARLVADIEEALARPAPPTALPTWLADRIGDRALAAALGQEAPPVLAVHPRRALDDVITSLAESGVRARRSALTPTAIVLDGRARVPAGLRADVWPMDDGSQAIALAVLPPPGVDVRTWAVLDACAGGGGKTRVLTAYGARVVSADLSRARLVRGVRELADPTRTNDAQHAGVRAAGGARDVEARRARRGLCVVDDGRAPPFRPGTFARVLVDAPCSGTGTLRRHPDVAHRTSPADVAMYAALQKELVWASLPLVRDGGVLVYATCSVLREENEDVIDAVLAKVPGGLTVTPAPLRELWGARVQAHALTLDAGAARARLLPTTDGCDGFFVAALRVERGSPGNHSR